MSVIKTPKKYMQYYHYMFLFNLPHGSQYLLFRGRLFIVERILTYLFWVFNFSLKLALITLMLWLYSCQMFLYLKTLITSFFVPEISQERPNCLFWYVHSVDKLLYFDVMGAYIRYHDLRVIGACRSIFMKLSI